MCIFVLNMLILYEKKILFWLLFNKCFELRLLSIEWMECAKKFRSSNNLSEILRAFTLSAKFCVIIGARKSIFPCKNNSKLRQHKTTPPAYWVQFMHSASRSSNKFKMQWTSFRMHNTKWNHNEEIFKDRHSSHKENKQTLQAVNVFDLYIYAVQRGEEEKKLYKRRLIHIIHVTYAYGFLACVRISAVFKTRRYALAVRHVALINNQFFRVFF